jgi:hypothetical protein
MTDYDSPWKEALDTEMRKLLEQAEDASTGSTSS